MAQTVIPIVNSEDRERLAAIVEDRNRSQKHVQRARIILLSAERLTVLEVAARSGASRPSVWRWQRRFAEQGVDGLLRDKTRKPGKAPLSPATIARVLALPCGEAPKAATHWTGRMVASAVPSALTQSDATGSRLSLARMSSAGLVQTNGLGLRLCSRM